MLVRPCLPLIFSATPLGHAFRLIPACSLLLAFSVPALHAATPIAGGGDGGGGTGGGTGGGSAPITQPATTPGPAYPWEGSLGDIKTGDGNKLTSIPIASWALVGGLAVDFRLNHNSQSSRNGELGPKWATSYDVSLTIDSTGTYFTVFWGDGRAYTFTKGSGNVFTSPVGIHDTLALDNNAGCYVLTTKDQVRYNFGVFVSSNHYQLSYISDKDYYGISLAYNSSNTLKSLADTNGRSLAFSYDASNRLALITDPLSRQWSLSYDGSGNLVAVYWPMLNGGISHIALGYDANHNITSYQDLRGNTSTFAYNSSGNTIAWEKDNVGNQTSFLYGVDANGAANAMDTTIIDPNGHKTVHTYNASGQLASVTDALGYTESYSYDGANNVTQRKDRNGQYWNSTFDSMGNVLIAKDPLSHTITYTYNARNEPLTQTWPSGRSVANTYSNDGVADLTQTQQKDASGNVLATTKYTIGSYGLVSDKYDPNNHHTSYTYNANGYLASTTTPLGNKTQWTYDTLGFQTSRTDAMSRTTTYTPDAWERNVTTTYPDNTTNTYGYDPNGNLTAFSNYASAWTRTYDANNRLLSESIPGTTIVSHTYDASGQKGLLSTTTDTDGRVISYGYTARNELAGTSEPGNTETYAYDADGNLLHRYLPNGLRTDQYYNADGTLDSFYNWNGGSTILQSYGYSYNADHQVTGYNEGTSSNVHGTANPVQVSYQYDGLGHLSLDSRTGNYAYAKSYAVDGAGNRTGMNENGAITALTEDADDELTSCSGTGAYSYTYNKNGDQITSTINGATTTFSYDFDDQLVGIQQQGGAATSYRYDALGRQVSRTLNGVFTGYYLDGDRILEEKTESSTKTYFWGLGLIRVGSEYPMTDGQGTTKLVTNGSQTITSTQETEAFGRSIGGTGSTGNPFGYHGSEGYRQDGDGPQGLEPYQKVGARYYDATFGRFITRDTVLTEKPYVYCDGDPVNYRDPSGHDKKDDEELLRLLEQLLEQIIKALMGDPTVDFSFKSTGGGYSTKGPGGTTTVTLPTISITGTYHKGKILKRQDTRGRGRF